MGGRITLSANERIDELLHSSIQAKFAYVNKLNKHTGLVKDMDTSILNTLSLIAPDLMEEMELRALILERVAALEPIGRRALAARLHLAEREVRAAAEALKKAGCLTQSASGMELTPQGQSLVEAARAVSGGRRTLSGIELTLSQMLGVERVCVVRGDADIDSGVMEEVARAAARQIRFLLQGAHVMAVTGGRTVAKTAEAIAVAAPMEITVVPAQGGMGGINPLRRFRDGTLYEDWMIRDICRFLVDYECDGFFAADGFAGLVIPLENGCYGEDMIAQFTEYTGIEVPPGTTPQRADYIWTHLRGPWAAFYADRWAAFHKKLADAIASIGKRLTAFTPFQMGPADSLYMFGYDYRKSCQAGLHSIALEIMEEVTSRRFQIVQGWESVGIANATTAMAAAPSLS